MTHAFRALLLAGGAVAMSQVALAAEDYDTPHVLDKVTIVGAHSVPANELYPVLQEHAGAKVTKSEIIADRDALSKALEDKHVTGSVMPSIALLPASKHVNVTFTIKDTGIQTPQTVKVAPKLHQQVFQGNASVSSDKLQTATGLHPGDELSNEKLAAAQQAVVQAYKDAKLPVSVNVGATPKSLGNGTDDIVWQITETKGKKPKNPRHNTEDEGGVHSE